MADEAMAPMETPDVARSPDAAITQTASAASAIQAG
jgi:hypothetical protein